MQTARQYFSSRLGLLLSVLGIAVGTGNIWRFPRIAAQNGGDVGAGAFLVVWLVFLFLWSIPLIVAEYALGQKGRMGVVGTFWRVGGRSMTWLGGFVALVSTAIMFYYAVVTGWCLYYAGVMLTRPLPQSLPEAERLWEHFQAGWGPVLLQAVALGFAVAVLWTGVRAIERVNRLLMPTLLGILLLALVRALTLEGSFEGLRYLFTPQWDQLLQPRLWLEALTQNAWDTGAGWGLILTYAAYMRREHGVVKNAFMTGVGNNTVSLLAAMTIFGTVFAVLGAELSRPQVLEVMRASGPASTGLTFIWLPQLFACLPLGKVLAVLFFIGLSFAAFTSLIAMVELAVRVLMDLGMARSRALIWVGSVGWLLGLPSALNVTVLSNQDFVWGVGLMLSGAFVALVVMRYGPARLRAEVMEGVAWDWRLGRGWDVLMRWLVPMEAVVLLGWWLYQAGVVYAPARWYDPLEPYSVMTCLVQWSVALLALRAFNGWMVHRLSAVRAFAES
jgi:NSS family neurotransmitter:Na+ symporter